MLDRLGPEGREQWLVDRTQAPGPEDGDQQFGRARQQAGNGIARLYPETVQQIGKTRRGVLELPERPGGALAVAALPDQGDPVRIRVAVAALDTGIHG